MFSVFSELRKITKNILGNGKLSFNKISIWSRQRKYRRKESIKIFNHIWLTKKINFIDFYFRLGFYRLFEFSIFRFSLLSSISIIIVFFLFCFISILRRILLPFVAFSINVCVDFCALRTQFFFHVYRFCYVNWY